MSRLDALPKVSGAVRYTQDLQPPNVCHLVWVRSPFPHARIVSTETSAARAVPGVLAVLTADDLPDVFYGCKVIDVPIIARGEVRYVGERVAAVVAESRDIAERAAALVDVDYEPLPAVFTIDEAVAPGAVAVHDAPWTYPGAMTKAGDGVNRQWKHTVSVGDVEQALSGTVSTTVVDCTYTTPGVHQGYIEPHASIADWTDAEKLQVWVANKSPYALRRELSQCLNVAMDRIQIHPMPLGGDFGGKGTALDVPVALLASRHVGRPVKIQLNHPEDMSSTNPRHDTKIRVRLGCDADGRLTGLDLYAQFNGGAYAGMKPGGNFAATFTTGDAYRIPAVHIVGERLYTHTVPRGNMRTPGAPQLYFAFESALDELAHKAGFDPVQFRLNNFLTVDERPEWGAKAEELRGPQTLRAALSAFVPESVPEGWKSGVGVALYHRGTHVAETSVRVQRHQDGGVTVRIPFPETGTGSHEVARRAFSSALGCLPEQVRVEQVSTDDLPPAAGIGGSRATTGLWAAAAESARQLKTAGAGEEITVVVESGGGDHEVTSFCVEVAQVAVDPETGTVKVPVLVAAVDVAAIVNPLAHRIQIEGGMLMGFGTTMMEDLALSEGKVTAGNLGEYKLPTMADSPRLDVVLVPDGIGVGPANIKSVGELSNVPTSAAIANAIFNATGVRIRSLPLTAEKIFWGILMPEGTSG